MGYDNLIARCNRCGAENREGHYSPYYKLGDVCLTCDRELDALALKKAYPDSDVRVDVIEAAFAARCEANYWDTPDEADEETEEIPAPPPSVWDEYDEADRKLTMEREEF